MAVITKNDINKVYTKKIQDYFSNGYIINSDTMTGHQGEVAKIDLTNGNEVIRVRLQKDAVKLDDVRRSFLYDSLSIIIERFGMNCGATLWNGKGEMIEQHDFFYIDGRRRESKYDRYFTTKEEFIHMMEVKERRYSSRYKAMYKELTIRPEAINVLKRHSGYKRTKLEDITSIKKFDYDYTIYTKDKPQGLSIPIK